MLRTRLTERFGLDHPIISAPMGFAGGGRLAAAVAAAGGLGLIGAGYGEAEWLRTEFAAAGNQGVGCGFITWSLARQPALLELVLAHRPRAVMFSFGDPAGFLPQVRAAGVPVLAQVQTAADAEHVLDLGVDVVVAQGTEAGGHGASRATFTLVPEIADLIESRAPETLLVAAGGVGDGRGLAAALALGADGVLVGTRLWASEEAIAHPRLKAAAVARSGDDTLRSRVIDTVRGIEGWPARYSLRTLTSGTTDRWHGREAELAAVAAEEAAAYAAAAAEGDPQVVSALVGEAIGLIHAVEPAGTIVARMAAEAEGILRNARGWVR